MEPGVDKGALLFMFFIFHSNVYDVNAVFTKQGSLYGLYSAPLRRNKTLNNKDIIRVHVYNYYILVQERDYKTTHQW